MPLQSKELSQKFEYGNKFRATHLSECEQELERESERERECESERERVRASACVRGTALKCA